MTGRDEHAEAREIVGWECPRGDCSGRLVFATREPAGEDADVETVRAMIFCPEHRMRDCSPLLNGCSRVIQAHTALDRLAARVRAEREARYEAALREIAEGYDGEEFTDPADALERRIDIARAVLARGDEETRT